MLLFFAIDNLETLVHCSKACSKAPEQLVGCELEFTCILQT